MLPNKHALIIGASGLIGRHITQACLDAGAKVTAAGRARADGRSVFTTPAGSEIPFVAVDTSDPQSVAAMFERAEAANGPVDGVVNCEFPRNERFGAKFEDVAFADFCDNVNAHLGGAFLVCQKAADYFTARGGGNIVNFSSVYGFMTPRFEIYEGTPMTKEIEYVVCKSAIIQMTRYLARYLKGRNVRVNCISPGGVFNDQPEPFVEKYEAHCLNKGMLAPEDVAGSVVFLLSDAAAYVNGQNLVVDDGFAL
jgi:NAD(P)-dependent dehydrogenase (short-subunit alcohol dehydrogenase family)